MKRLVVILCLLASLSLAAEFDVYYSLETYQKETNNIADMLIDLFDGQQVYPPKASLQEKRDIALSGLTPVYKIDKTSTNLVGYTGKRIEAPTTGGQILYRATEAKIKEWESAQKVTTNDVFKKDGQIIKATAVEIEK